MVRPASDEEKNQKSWAVCFAQSPLKRNITLLKHQGWSWGRGREGYGQVPYFMVSTRWNGWYRIGKYKTSSFKNFSVCWGIRMLLVAWYLVLGQLGCSDPGYRNLMREVLCGMDLLNQLPKKVWLTSSEDLRCGSDSICKTVLQLYVPLYCWVVFYYMNVPSFVYLTTC